MKKIFIIVLFGCFLLAGCGINSEGKMLKDLEKKLDKMRGYNLISELTIHNNDEVYHYNLDVGYKKDNYYRIEFVNTSNDHRQILLKNDDGVYVITLRSLQQKII